MTKSQLCIPSTEFKLSGKNNRDKHWKTFHSDLLQFLSIRAFSFVFSLLFKPFVNIHVLIGYLYVSLDLKARAWKINLAKCRDNYLLQSLMACEKLKTAVCPRSSPQETFCKRSFVARSEERPLFLEAQSLIVQTVNTSNHNFAIYHKVNSRRKCL